VANNDYQLPSGSACFAGIGQAPSTATGGDVVYTFTAPAAGDYSFRVREYDGLKNAVLYVGSDCPGGPPPATVTSCLGAANRNSGFPAEEVACLPLAASQAVYVYVDEHAPTSGSPFLFEVNTCTAEVEPNDAPVSAVEALCGIEGSIDPAADADFFGLGVPDADSRVFALVDGAAGNSTDFDLRVTSGSDTLEYDDLNNDISFGSVAPNVAGTKVGGSESYLRVTHYSPSTRAEPYRLYGTVQPPSSSATAEVEPNDSIATATAGANVYYSGALSGTSDADIFSFDAAAGDLVVIGADFDPSRDNTPFNGSLTLLDPSGETVQAVNDSGSTSSQVPGTGSLGAGTPYSPAEAITYRINTPGTYYAKVGWSSGSPGDYLLSISHNCKISPATDLAVSQTDSPDPVAEGEDVTYVVTVSNLAAAPASVVTLRDDLPAEGSFVSATPNQGSCTGSGPVICHLGTIAGGGTATVDIVVTAPQEPGTMTNTAAATTVVIDTSAANDSSQEATTVGTPPDADDDGVPDNEDCAPLDPTAWAVPGEAADLRFPVPGNEAHLEWDAPGNAGGPVVFYDLLRSLLADDFSSPACVVRDTTETTAEDPDTAAHAFFYLARSKNVCGGNLGTGSGETPRTGGACP
jgi:uncharacterized repeat protein (TIGR01451 family)